MNYQTEVTWCDPQTTYALRHNKHRRDTNIHKYWVLEGCPAYYLSDLLFDSEDEVNGMRASTKQANFFYMTSIQKKYGKTLYRNFNDEVILRCYYKAGLVDLHLKALALFPHSTECQFEFVMNYNERHIASKLESYLGQPTIICYVDDPCWHDIVRSACRISVDDGAL